jgi:hypothetical protein
MENHSSLSIHSLSVRVSSLWDGAQTNIIDSFSSTSTSLTSFIRVASIFSSMSLRPSKRILRTSLNLSLSNMFLSYDSFNLIISRWRCKTFLCFRVLITLIVSFNTNILCSLEVTRQHLNCVSFSLKFIYFLSLLF